MKKISQTQRQRIIKKVLSKINQKNSSLQNKDGGWKDWAAGAAVLLTSTFGSMGQAVASPLDVAQFLNKVTPTLERGGAEVSKSYKSIDNLGSGTGSFKINVGPYLLSGEYGGENNEYADKDIDYFKTTLKLTKDGEDDPKAKASIRKIKQVLDKEIKDILQDYT